MTRSFMNPDADYTPNDMGPPDKLSEETRTPKEVGDSELATIEEWVRLKEQEMLYD